MAQADDENSFFTKAASNPWVALPYILGTGLGAAASPAFARGAAVTNQGLNLGLNIEEQRRKDAKNQRLSEALGSVLNTTQDRPVTRTGVNPETADFFTLDQGGNGQGMSDVFNIAEQPLAPAESLPTYGTTEKTSLFTPMEKAHYGALLKAGHPAGVIEGINKKLARDTEPFGFTSPREGAPVYRTNKVTGQVEQVVPATPKTEKPTYHYVQDETGTHRIENRPGAVRETIPGIGGKQEPRPAQLTSIYDVEASSRTNPRTGKRFLGAEDPDITPDEFASIRAAADAKKALADLKHAEENARIQRESRKTEGIKNPADWMRYNEETNDIETAPGDITPEGLKAGGYREIKSLKDREKILQGTPQLDLQFQKLQALTDEFKNTSWANLKLGEWTGGNLGSTAGAIMEGTARQTIQMLEQQYGGLRAGSSKPLIDAAKQTLVPTAYDTASVVDIKMKGLDVLVSGLKDSAKRAAFGKGIDPKVISKVQEFTKMIKEQSAKESGGPSPARQQPNKPKTLEEFKAQQGK